MGDTRHYGEAALPRQEAMGTQLSPPSLATLFAHKK